MLGRDLLREFPELRRVAKSKPGCQFSFAPLVELTGSNKVSMACVQAVAIVAMWLVMHVQPNCAAYAAAHDSAQTVPRPGLTQVACRRWPSWPCG